MSTLPIAEALDSFIAGAQGILAERLSSMPAEERQRFANALHGGLGLTISLIATPTLSAVIVINDVEGKQQEIWRAPLSDRKVFPQPSDGPIH